jgi:hypothetical protein
VVESAADSGTTRLDRFDEDELEGRLGAGSASKSFE